MDRLAEFQLLCWTEGGDDAISSGATRDRVSQTKETRKSSEMNDSKFLRESFRS